MPLVWTWKIHSKDKEYSWGGKSFSARISKNQVLDTKGLVEVTLNEFQDHQVFQDHLNLYILLSILRLLMYRTKNLLVWLKGHIGCESKTRAFSPYFNPYHLGIIVEILLKSGYYFQTLFLKIDSLNNLTKMKPKMFQMKVLFCVVVLPIITSG